MFKKRDYRMLVGVSHLERVEISNFYGSGDHRYSSGGWTASGNERKKMNEL